MLLSKCHEAEMTVVSSNEGTNSYKCLNCGEPCDWINTDATPVAPKPSLEEIIPILRNLPYMGGGRFEADIEHEALKILTLISQSYISKETIREALKDNGIANYDNWVEPIVNREREIAEMTEIRVKTELRSKLLGEDK